jgi:tripartite-type tricarboxylate transporter receptor subunit TctC
VRREFRSTFAALLCGFMLLGGSAAWSAYPEKPIWWVVPYSPGGSADVISRIITVRIGERLNQRILIENKPGAGGSIGAEFVARAAPDGHTVLHDALAIAVNPALKSMKFDPGRELTPVTQISNMWVIMTAPANAPYNTLAEFIEFARRNPASYGSTGAGSAGHLTGELFKSQSKLDIVHVPYKGGGPGVVAAMAGEVSIYYAIAGSAMGAIKSGKLKALAVAAPSRYAPLPNIPTFSELGYADVVASEWNGLFVPKGTPQEIVDLLNKEARAVLAEPAVQEKLVTTLGIDIVTNTPAEFGQFVQREATRWGRVIKQLNIRAD